VHALPSGPASTGFTPPASSGNRSSLGGVRPRRSPHRSEVIAVGPGGRDESGKLIPIDIKEGDRVLFGKWSGTEVKIDGEELLIMKESDIMGIIDEPISKKKAA
jgi:chaperonin GroES